VAEHPNGGKLKSNVTDLCPKCGTQSLSLDASISGSTSGVSEFFDSDNRDVAVIMNGTYKLSFWAKATVGSPALTVTALRPGGGSYFSCGPYSVSLSSVWTQYTQSCTTNESASTVVAQTPFVQWSVTGGTVYLDNVDLRNRLETTPTRQFCVMKF